jgi:3-methyladenine DNA glycosylase AlkD
MVVQRYCKTTSSCSHTKDDFHRLGDEVEENDKKLLKEKIRELKNMIGEFSPNTKEFKEEIERENLLRLLIDEDKPLSVKEIADLIGIREDVISEYQLDLYKTGY